MRTGINSDDAASEHPHISIIVPFLNSGRYVAQCVGALLEQSYPERKYEVIMVDNNSTDGSALCSTEFCGQGVGCRDEK